MKNGALQFHTSLPYRKGELPGDIAGRLIAMNLFTADLFFPGFMAVLYAGISPSEAVSKIEQTVTKPQTGSDGADPQPPSRIQFN